MLTAGRTWTCAPSQWASACWTASTRMRTRRARKSTTRSPAWQAIWCSVVERHQRRIRHSHRQQAHQRHAHCHAAGRRARRRPRAVRQNAGPRGQGRGGQLHRRLQCAGTQGLLRGRPAADRRPSPAHWPRPTLSAPASISAPPKRASTWTPSSHDGRGRARRPPS